MTEAALSKAGQAAGAHPGPKGRQGRHHRLPGEAHGTSAHGPTGKGSIQELSCRQGVASRQVDLGPTSTDPIRMGLGPRFWRTSRDRPQGVNQQAWRKSLTVVPGQSLQERP